MIDRHRPPRGHGGAAAPTVAPTPTGSAPAPPATVPTPAPSGPGSGAHTLLGHPALTPVLLVILVFGVGTVFWSLVGLGRLLLDRRRRKRHLPGPRVTTDRVAVLIAAHNEEMVIAQTIRAAAALVPRTSIHVVSDGSRDGTATMAHAAGARVLDLHPNRGKAAALAAGIEHFRLLRDFEVVMLLDADTHLAANYLTTGLPLFDDPSVVAVAGSAQSIMDPMPRTVMGRILVSYRARLYVIVQRLLKYGQAARWANAVSIVPGFASMYRTSALRAIDVIGAGLVIEDFNMTFEIHRKKLGRIAFHPSAAIAHTQDPDNFHDYRRQVARWTLGFWQTVRRHRLHQGIFWAALAGYLLELAVSAFVILLVIPVLVISTAAALLAAHLHNPAGWLLEIGAIETPKQVALGFLLPDYLLTVFAALVCRRPSMLFYGLTYPLLRIVDAAVCLKMVPRAWSGTSTGTWVSPLRRFTIGHHSHNTAGHTILRSNEPVRPRRAVTQAASSGAHPDGARQT